MTTVQEIRERTDSILKYLNGSFSLGNVHHLDEGYSGYSQEFLDKHYFPEVAELVFTGEAEGRDYSCLSTKTRWA